MRVVVDRDLCIGCGNCVYLLPDLFDQHDDGTVLLLAENPGQALHKSVRDAVAECPARAILIVE